MACAAAQRTGQGMVRTACWSWLTTAIMAGFSLACSAITCDRAKPMPQTHVYEKISQLQGHLVTSKESPDGGCPLDGHISWCGHGDLHPTIGCRFVI